MNPRLGAAIAVVESARNVACTGAVPVAITNCLNFGNPYKPGVYWQFKEAIAGIAEACRVLNTPVTGGNVSFYNESPTTSVYPTPVIGMLGVIEDVRKALSAAFRTPGDRIYLLGKPHGTHIGGSEYLSAIHKKVLGDAPAVDLDEEKRLQGLLVRLSQTEIVRSAHDCAEGGLAVAIAECCITARERRLGARINLPRNGSRLDSLMFGEDQSRVVVSTDPSKCEELVKAAGESSVEITLIGEVTSQDRLEFTGIGEVSLQRLDEAYYGSLAGKMGRG